MDDSEMTLPQVFWFAVLSLEACWSTYAMMSGITVITLRREGEGPERAHYNLMRTRDRGQSTGGVEFRYVIARVDLTCMGLRTFRRGIFRLADLSCRPRRTMMVQINP